jgi:hypothetical protein
MSDEPKKPDAKQWGRWPAATFATLAAYLLSAGLIDGIRLTWTTNRLRLHRSPVGIAERAVPRPF